MDDVAAAPEEARAANRIRLLLADDHMLLRQALRALLETDSQFEIVAEVGSVAGALEATARLEPDIAVTDIGMPDKSGIDFATELRERRSTTRVLILTGHAHEEYVRAAVNAGVMGYVLKDASHAELVKGLRTVYAGHMFLSVCGSTRTPILPSQAPPEWLSRITLRERHILAGIARGCGNKEMARVLNLSVKTIEKHRGNLMRKLDVHGTAALTLLAVNHGLVSFPQIPPQSIPPRPKIQQGGCSPHTLHLPE
jgi:DNA-binding NarL/FixJ family response regulator